MGMPSMEPDVWRKDVRRAKERIGKGQILIVSVVGTPLPGADAEALIADYARCAQWAADAGADAIELHLAVPDPYAEQPQMIYENIPLAAQILYRMRTSVSIPILAKTGASARRGSSTTPRPSSPRGRTGSSWCTASSAASSTRWDAAFDGTGRDRADVVGADTFPVASRQIEELLSWRKAGAWDRAILAVGGITTAERAEHLLTEGADAALVATAALSAPLLAVRFREQRATAVA